MSDGFRSAEIGAFTLTSACKPGCGPAGHVAGCAMLAGVVWNPTPAVQSCPHCGAVLGTAAIINSGPATFTTTT